MRARAIASWISFASFFVANAGARAEPLRPFEMPPLSAGTEIHSELMVGSMRFSTDVEGTTLALDSGVRHRIGPLGLSVSIPAVHRDHNVGDGAGLGNISIGVLYLITAPDRAGPHDSLVLGASTSLPTGGKSGYLQAGFRIADPGHYWPDTTTLRIFSGWRTGADTWFAQAELALYALLREVDDEFLLRVALGAGKQLSPTFAVIGEITTMSDLPDSDGLFGTEPSPFLLYSGDFIHALNLGARVRAGSSTLGFRLYSPIDRRFGAVGFAFDVTLEL